MLWNASLLDEFTIAAADGSIGRISDCLFDDETMAVRWFVLDTGKLFPGRKVLIPPGVVQPDTDRRVLRIDMTIQDIEDSPDLDADAPVSRQQNSACTIITAGSLTGWVRPMRPARRRWQFR